MSLLFAPLHARRPPGTDLDRLRAENRALRRKVVALEDALLGAEADALPIPLPRMQRTLLRLLMRQPRATAEQCLSAMEAVCPTRDGRDPNGLHCAIYRLRGSLQPQRVAVRGGRHAGYWIEPADKARLRAAFAA